MKKCEISCQICSFIINKNTIIINNISWNILQELSHESTNVVYAIICVKENCLKFYIGETEREFLLRLKEHLGYIQNKNLNQPTGRHFNQNDHTIYDMRAIVLEKVKKSCELYRKEREKYFIRKFNATHDGLNKK